ncbi:MAG: 23S rRNA (guanosine(2251)-2'-O)-methyltransferase RlmB [Actinomycetota bacterium]|nr:23S rRNA (guanosine(2251)-2'-O)-methyltransferase RlmB [Actinomycetota bacterium]MDH5312778.1 23S rRNA (guanosine(2251)-2'-O)-methyltransferase RlmB [Actinomycetota bacterium]
MSRERDPARRRRPAHGGTIDLDVVGGRRAVAEALRAGRVSEVLVVSCPKVTQGLRAVFDAARDDDVPVRTVPRATLDALTTGHQGIVARVGARRSDALSERDLAAFPFEEDALVVVLDGITDPQNLGAAARSAEAAGAAMLVTRVRRAAEVTPAAVRASAGALMHLPHARVANVPRAIERLQDNGFWVVGLDESSDVSVYDDVVPSGRLTVVVGTEDGGMSRLTRERCDQRLKLPMLGQVGSLNAAASLAAFLYVYVVPSRR